MFRRAGITLSLGLAAMWGLTGCLASEADRPPNYECGDNGCPLVSGSTSGSSGSGGTSSAGTSTAAAAGQATLQGQIVEVTESNFALSSAARAAGNFTVTVPGAQGNNLSSTETSEFTLEGVKSSQNLWIAAKSVPATTYLPSVVAVDSIAQSKVVIPVLRSSELSLVASSITTAFVPLDTTLGQVVIRFVNASGAAVKGLKLSFSGAGAIAYDEGGAYTTDKLMGTGARGLAFLLNVGAGTVPSLYPVTVSGAATGTIYVWIQAGAVTILELDTSAP